MCILRENNGVLNIALKRLGVEAIEVRKPEQLEELSALIIPGGESTTMAKLAVQYNLVHYYPLQCACVFL